MAFDGIAVSALRKELNDKLTGGKIAKIAQPEAEEILLTVNNNRDSYKLLISVNASLPFLYLTSENKPSPVTAPTFVMMLRKHIANGRIVGITQLGLERVLFIEIEHLNELGDLCRKKLIIEIMGKHSNIIFVDDNDNILDSIKHISANISSIREVLPGRRWFFPEELKKADALTLNDEQIAECIRNKPQPLFKALYSIFAGISPLSAQEIVHRAGLSDNRSVSELSEDELIHFSRTFYNVLQDVREENFDICVYSDGETPADFSAINLTMYPSSDVSHYTSLSEVLVNFYATRNKIGVMKSKSSELRKLITNLIERASKKLDILEKQLRDNEDREKYRIYGELLTTYGYSLEPGLKKVTLNNYYDGSDVTISLDPELSAIDNAKKYFNRYAKSKRMYEATTVQVEQTKDELMHLESILMELTIATDENDLKFIRKEMQDFGYIKKHAPSGKKGEKLPKAGKPYHFVTEDGFDIYVGRNNYQNEELTFEFADGGDFWFHAKAIPGSHVIVKSGGRELPDHVYEDAGALAAHFSSAQGQAKVEVDYIQRKHVKKTPGGKPGFVIYHTNYSLIAGSDISHLREIK
ncbi:MAG: NFACT family protein [Lachnospiraceae bacterium]|nr:NFACT family protein [Lachnospiraceae bacterium]